MVRALLGVERERESVLRVALCCAVLARYIEIWWTEIVVVHRKIDTAAVECALSRKV